MIGGKCPLLFANKNRMIDAPNITGGGEMRIIEGATLRDVLYCSASIINHRCQLS